VFRSEKLGIEVARSVEFDRVEINLLRLVGRQAPEQEVWVTDRPINRILFDNVLEARGSDFLGQIPTGLSRPVIEEQLRLYAELLRTVVPGLPQGKRRRSVSSRASDSGARLGEPAGIDHLAT
jgi:hypothetical protein